MALRRAYFLLLLPAAIVLPLWLLVSWIAFGGGALSLLWVLLVAAPAVFVGQLLLTVLVRIRPGMGQARALSWQDVVGFGVWHALTIAVGATAGGAFGWALAGAIIAFGALMVSTLWQLWRAARDRVDANLVVLDEEARRGGSLFADGPERGTASASDDVYVLRERDPGTDAR